MDVQTATVADLGEGLGGPGDPGSLVPLILSRKKKKLDKEEKPTGEFV